MSNPPEIPVSLAGQPIPESLLNIYTTIANAQDADQAATALLTMFEPAEEGHRPLVYSLRGAMSILFDRSDVDKAARLLAVIERLSTRLAEPWALAFYHYSQGQFDYNITSDYDSAAKHYAEAARDLEDPSFRASALHTLAEMHLHLGQLARAENAFHDSIAVATQCDFQQGIAEGYHGLGSTAFSRRNFADAQKYFERSLQEAERSQTSSFFEQFFPVQNPERSNILDKRADLQRAQYASQQNAYNSLQSAHQSQIYILIAQNIIMLGIVAANDADLSLAQETYLQAEEHLMRFKSALPTESYQRASSALMANRAILALRSGNIEEARKYADLALEHQSMLMLTEQIENLDIVGQIETYSGELRNAKKHLFAAFQLAKKAHFLGGLLRVCTHLSDAYILDGWYESAYRLRGIAIDAMEHLRIQVGAEEERLRYIQDWTEHYNSIVMLCLLLRHLKQAPHFLRYSFLYVERSRSRAFIDLLGRTLTLPPPPSLPGELLAKEEANLIRIHELENLMRTPTNENEQARLQTSYNEAQIRLEETWQQIAEQAPEYAALRRGLPATFDDIVTLLTL